MSDNTFDFNLFLKESRDVLVNPKPYFAALSTKGGMTEPIIKAVIYGAISGAITFIWNMLHIGVISNGMFSGSAIGIMAFIWAILGAVIFLFVGSVILLVISSICKGNTDFEACMRVTATTMVIMPVSSFFNFTGHFNVYFGAIVSIAIGIYALWLLYNGLVETLKANPETSKIVIYVLIALMIIFTLTGISASQRANRYFNDLNSQNLTEIRSDSENSRLV
jgi:hypothetical protein